MTETAKKKNSLSRDQASAIYEDLRKNFAAYSDGQVAKMKPEELKSKLSKAFGSVKPTAAKPHNYQRPVQRPKQAEYQPSMEEQMLEMMLAKQASKKAKQIGNKIAVTMVLLAAAFKLSLGALEYSGVLSVENAQASMADTGQVAFASNTNFSPEQVALLKALDGRRVELEERRKSLDKREAEFNTRDREFAVKLAELRELTQTLKGNREAESKKRTTQLDQLSNVYSSMDPKEAALLVDQLDDSIAIELLNRMPEKRIGQILSLMNKEKALMMTKMLSGRVLAQ